MLFLDKFLFLDVLGELKDKLPTGEGLASFGTGAFRLMTVVILVFVGLVVAGLLVYMLMRARKYKNKIRIFKKVGNQWEEAGKDRAFELKYNISGDSIFKLMKRKKILPRPELQTGRNTYWYAVREDGEWINIALGDIDLQMKQAGVRFLHPEMRAIRTAIERNLKERFDKPKFLERYGVMIINIAAIAIIMIFLWLIVDKILAAQSSSIAATEAAAEVLKETKTVIAALNNLKSGSGYVSAG